MSRQKAENATIQHVHAAIERSGRGAVFTPGDFHNLGSRNAVKQSLSRLARAGTIRRLARGIYDYPKISTRLGPLTPAPELVAQALARHEGFRLQTSGARATNVLGLSTQVPAQLTYLTEGTPRRRQVGNQVIELRRASPRRLRGAGTVAGMAIEALRELGPRGVGEKHVIAQLRAQLSPKDKRELRELSAGAPAWMLGAIDKITAGARHSGAARSRATEN